LRGKYEAINFLNLSVERDAVGIERFDGEADESAVSWEGAAACDTSRLPYLSYYYHYHYLARSYSPGESRPFALCSVYAPCYPYSFVMHERRHHTTDDMAED